MDSNSKIISVTEYQTLGAKMLTADFLLGSDEEVMEMEWPTKKLKL